MNINVTAGVVAPPLDTQLHTNIFTTVQQIFFTIQILVRPTVTKCNNTKP